MKTMKRIRLFFENLFNKDYLELESQNADLRKQLEVANDILNYQAKTIHGQRNDIQQLSGYYIATVNKFF